MSMVKTMGAFRDSRATSWPPGPQTDVPAEPPPPYHIPWLWHFLRSNGTFSHRIIHDNFFYSQHLLDFKWNFLRNLTCLLITYIHIHILLLQFDQTFFDGVIDLFHLRCVIQHIGEGRDRMVVGFTTGNCI
jgi:hypothetical protein